jgi:mRNA-degrading endonuclease RelE of RelBE toxin-antitoxin system
VNGWQFVIHQHALETIDHLRPSDRRQVRAALFRLIEDPWQIPDAEIRPPNDRIYLVKNVRSLRVVYWLDAFAREVYIVRVDCPK